MMLDTTEDFNEYASLYCPHCNKYQDVDDYELTGIDGVDGLATDASCNTCSGVLVVQ